MPAERKKWITTVCWTRRKSFIVPLMLVGAVVVVVLLIAGLFMPPSIKAW